MGWGWISITIVFDITSISIHNNYTVYDIYCHLLSLGFNLRLQMMACLVELVLDHMPTYNTDLVT